MQKQDLELNRKTLRTRTNERLDLMNSAVQRSELVAQLSAVVPPKATGHPPFALGA